MKVSRDLRILSLLPASTEMICLLGLENNLVGISHNCDWPFSIRHLPRVTSTSINNSMSSTEINKKVMQSKHKGLSIFHIDEKLLDTLHPSLIITQELCPVCATSLRQVKSLECFVHDDSTVISLEPDSITGIFDNILTIGKYTDKKSIATEKVGQLKDRLEALQKKIKKATKRKPTVAVIEWLDPLMTAAHWVPDMIHRADGEMLLAKNGERSRQITWNEIIEINPDILIIAPCGFDIAKTKEEMLTILNNDMYQNLPAVKNKKTYYIDGNAYLTRPGPRVVDGIEIFAEVLYPEIFKRTYSIDAWQKL